MSSKLLKVLTGPHQGAEIELPPGAITLGSGSETDVIFDDRTVRDKHIEITDHGENGVRVHFFKSGFVDTRPIEAGNDLDLADFEVVSLGTTSICIGPVDQQWPLVRVPDWAKLAEQVAPEPAPRKAIGDHVEPREGDIRKSDSEEESREPVVPVVTDFPDSVPAKTPVSKGRRAAGIVILCLIFGLLFASVVLVVGFGFGPSNGGALPSAAAMPTTDWKATLDAISSEYGLKMEQQQEVYILSGLVQTPQIRDELTRKVLPLEPYVRCDVYTPDQIKTAADAVLRGFEFAVSSTCSDQGVLRLAGWAPSEDAWKRALVRVRNDVPGIVAIEEEVGFLSNVSAQLTADLENAGLTDVRLTLNNGTLTCRGGVPEDRVGEWKNIVSAWVSEIPAIESVKDETVPIVTTVTPEESSNPAAEVAKMTGLALPGPVISATLYPVPSFRTADGSVFFIGARLSDGFVVETITSTEITFARGQTDIREYSLVESNAIEPVEWAPPTEDDESAGNSGT